MEELKKLEEMLREADPHKNPMWKTDLEIQLAMAKLAISTKINHLNTMMEILGKCK